MTHRSRFLSFAVLCALGACVVDEDPALEETSQALSSSLMSRRGGFASAVTGGLNGTVCRVTRDAATDPDGGLALRACVESGPDVWIIFDEDDFPAAVKKSIYLDEPLALESNTTIDGRGSYVSIRRRYSYVGTTWSQTSSGAWECELSPNPGPIIRIHSAQNVIVTNLDFVKEFTDESALPAEVRAIPVADRDNQCFDDAIWIGNSNGSRATAIFDNIWIDHSNFTSCGDECISVRAPNYAQVARVTLSNNKISYVYKGMVLGAPGDMGTTATTRNKITMAVSVYQNRFVGVRERQPRVQAAAANVFNNLYEDWKGGVVQSQGNWDPTKFAPPWSEYQIITRVVAHHNAYRYVTTTANPWSVTNQTGDSSLRILSSDAQLWARDNVSVDEVDHPIPITSSFPACGAWYYPCNAIPTVEHFETRGYVWSRDWVRSVAGHSTTVVNDVRVPD